MPIDRCAGHGHEQRAGLNLTRVRGDLFYLDSGKGLRMFKAGQGPQEFG